MTEPPPAFDYLIAGGGLHGSLAALSILHHAPRCKLGLVEAAGDLCGNHTWSFFCDHMPEEAWPWLAPLVDYRWPAYRVRFPNLTRLMPHEYGVITSKKLARAVRARLRESSGGKLFLGRTVVRVAPDRLLLDDSTSLRARCVIDARGLPVSGTEPRSGAQKFLGLEMELKARSSLPELPLIMDATVEQTDGFRFFYVLPFSPGRVMIEETFFSEREALDPKGARGRILDYAARMGIRAPTVIREESGVLPMSWSISRQPVSIRPFTVGLRGGWSHPATGYSLPEGVAIACMLGKHAPAPPPEREIRALWGDFRRRSPPFLFLNWMLFRATPGPNRWRLLERFYSLPQGVIHRWYGRHLSKADPIRILFWPPVNPGIFRIPPVAPFKRREE
jgi:lycopene beta-cyclase